MPTVTPRLIEPRSERQGPEPLPGAHPALGLARAKLTALGARAAEDTFFLESTLIDQNNPKPKPVQSTSSFLRAWSCMR